MRKGAVDEFPAADVTVVAASRGPPGGGSGADRRQPRGLRRRRPLGGPGLVALDPLARSRRRTVAIGTAMAPGLSCVLAAQLRDQLDRVDEVHVASAGTGGPDCARRHHVALTATAVDWEEGEWRRRAGGSGRELVWFPEPVGGADCYRAGLADPMLLVPAFPGCRRVTSRLEATRRDRLTSWLPMLRPPHPEGLTGRGPGGGPGLAGRPGRDQDPGRRGPPVSGRRSRGRPGGAVGRVGAAVPPGCRRTGGAGNAPGSFLRDLGEAGVVVAEFQGGRSGGLTGGPARGRLSGFPVRAGARRAGSGPLGLPVLGPPHPPVQRVDDRDARQGPVEQGEGRRRLKSSTRRCRWAAT